MPTSRVSGGARTLQGQRGVIRGSRTPLGWWAVGSGGERRGVGWSAAYLLTSRVSTLAAVPVLLSELRGVDLYADLGPRDHLHLRSGTGRFWLVRGRGPIRCARKGPRVAERSADGAVPGRHLLLRALDRGHRSVDRCPDIADFLPYLSQEEVEPAVAILRYTAIAFVATNVTLLLSATLQGLGRVDASYRAKTIGAAAYLPLLVFGMQILEPWDAAGVSMVGMYGIETILAVWVLVPEFRRAGDSTTEPPPWRAMFRMGIQWQVSSWADFATFQLPRILAAVGGTSRSVLIIDLGLRYGQAITTPLFAFYPIVLPSAATVWVREGMTGVTRLVQRYLSGTTDVFLVGAALLIPLAASAIEVWAGISLTKSEAAGTMAVALGMVVYASTGMFSAVLLAVDDLGDVMRYKTSTTSPCRGIAVRNVFTRSCRGRGSARRRAGRAGWLVRRARRASPWRAL